MALSYRSLPFENQKKAVMSILDVFSKISKNKIILAIEVSEELDTEEDKKFRLRQTLHTVLWEVKEAVSMGFDTWADSVLLIRHHAMIYHSLNSEECRMACEVCKMIKE